MFVGHYGVSFAAKGIDGSVPLWVLFLAVQLLDVVWAPLVLLGVEKVRIVPGFTATNPLDPPALAFGLEAVLLLAGLWLCLRNRPVRPVAQVAFGLVMLAIQAYVFFGPPPASGAAIAATALGSYGVFAWIAWWLADRWPAGAS